MRKTEVTINGRRSDDLLVILRFRQDENVNVETAQASRQDPNAERGATVIKTKTSMPCRHDPVRARGGRSSIGRLQRPPERRNISIIVCRDSRSWARLTPKKPFARISINHRVSFSSATTIVYGFGRVERLLYKAGLGNVGAFAGQAIRLILNF
jgi:hypothetical protein